MSRWDQIDAKVLRAIHELADGRYLDGPEIADRAGVDPGEIYRSAELLEADGLIDAEFAFGGTVAIRQLTPAGLRALREWPGGESVAEVLPELLARLADQLEAQGDTERSGLLKRSADVVQSVSTAVVAALLKETLGL